MRLRGKKIRGRHVAHPLASLRSLLASRRPTRKSAGETSEPELKPSVEIGNELRRVGVEGLRALHECSGIRNYHPLYGLTEDEQAGFPEPRRAVDIRWQHIQSNLPVSGSALDVGSQNGWFTFKLADHGLHATGIEGSARAVRAAQLLTVYNQSDRAAFQRLVIDPESVQVLPTVDVILCMAIFHHWVRNQGFEAAASIMQSLADRCRDRLFFESGQIDDTKSADRESLHFMGDDPLAWIEGFLRDLGFSEVVHLGELSRSTTNQRKRHLVVAMRS